MAKPERVWQVTPHDPIEQLDDNLWTVRGQIPNNPKGDRRMAIARLPDGALVFYNAIPLSDEALAQVNALGKPTYLVLPYNLHMMDGHAMQQRLGLLVFGPRGDAKMAARVKVEGAFEEFPKNDAVSIESAAGTRNGEAVMIVRSGGGARTSLVFCDVFMNIPAEGASLFPRLMGLAGGPKVPFVMKLGFVKDKKALRARLLALAALPGLTRLVPSHGDVVAADAPAILKRAAETI